MNDQKADMFIMTNVKYFESHEINRIKQSVKNLDESKWSILSTLQFKDPTTTLIISIIVGGLGVDRFIIGDIGLGIGKLLTCGGLGIWTIIDWFLIQKATRVKNMEQISQVLL